MTYVYGHRPPPVMTRNEQAILSVITDEFEPAIVFVRKLGNMNSESATVALVRLRNRGLVENSEPHYKLVWEGETLWKARLWRKTQPEEGSDEKAG